MKRKLKITMLVALAATQIILLPGCGKKKGADKKVTIVLDWAPSASNAGIYMAKEKGFFEDEGIDAEIVRPKEEGAEKQVDGNDAQFGISSQDTMAEYLASDSPCKITAVASLVQYNTAGILSRKGEGMDCPKGLEGKKYATWYWNIEEAMIQDVMEADGADAKKIDKIPNAVTDEAEALKKKQTDALFVSYQEAGIEAEKEEVSTEFFRLADYKKELNYYGSVLVVNNDYLKEHEDETRAVLQAIQKGYDYVKENKEESAKLICSKESSLDEDTVEAQISYLEDKYVIEGSKWGEIETDRWNEFYSWVNDKNLFKEKIKKEEALDLSYLPE